MEIVDFYPKPADMIANEIETVKCFENSPIIAEYLEFHSEARKVRGQSSTNSRGFSFASHFDLYHQHMPFSPKRKNPREKNVRLIFSVLIQQDDEHNYGNISYVFAICRLDRKRNSILRKFHFDVSVTKGTRQPQPMSHLQYCGEMIDVMSNLGYRETQLQQLHHKLREPRVFFSPISLALLVDMALREFGSEDLRSKFLNSPEWKKVIRNNEATVLGKFFNKCAEIANSADDKRLTLLDEFYIS